MRKEKFACVVESLKQSLSVFFFCGICRQTADCRPKIADCRPQIVECKLLNAKRI